jgi:D-alanyl-D-alanine carboxypeptidase
MRRDLEMVRLLDQTFAQIQANPTLVARASVPWQQVAQGAPAPAIAGFSLPQVSPNAFAALSPVPSTVQSEDEDAAEAIRAPDENIPLIHAEVAPTKPAPVNPAAAQTAAPQPATQAPAVPPLVAKAAPRPDNSLAAAQADLVRTAVNTPKPQMRPVQKEDAGEGDLESATPSSRRNWTIQIGAYADKALALEELKAYAGKAQDILAKASQIVAPLQSNNGHVIYRARFGLFAEQEARDVCNRLTQRGQTCFAAVQTR